MKREHGHLSLAARQRGPAASFAGTQLVIWDCAGVGKRVADNIAWAVGELCGVEAVAGDPPHEPDGLGPTPCLRIIEDARSLGDGDTDPHADELPGMVVQHLSKDHALTLSKGISRMRSGAVKRARGLNVLIGAIKELAIKVDVAAKSVTLYRHEVSRLCGTWTFGFAYHAESPDLPNENGPNRSSTRYAFVTIAPDGTLSFVEAGATEGLKTRLEALRFELMAEEGLEWAVSDPDGNVNSVRRTDLFAIPDYESIGRELASGNNRLRDDALRPALYGGMCPAAFCESDEDAGYYMVGLAIHGMRPSLPHATVLREVRAAPGSRLVFPEALVFVDADFVRLRMMAVSPFPIKYLRERLREKARVESIG